MSDYIATDPIDLYGDKHRGFIDLDGKQLNITITHEGIIIDLYGDDAGELLGTFANTFIELAEMIEEDN